MNSQDLLGNPEELKRGMEDLVVDTTSVSWVDGQNGKLYYRGIDIAELAAHASFEETAFLLLCGRLPAERALSAFTWKLRQAATTPEKILRVLMELPRSTPPLAALQTALAALACIDPSQRWTEEETLLEKAMKIISQTPVILAASWRHSIGLPILPPRPELSYPENFLYMLTGQMPTQLQARAMEVALILQMDHGFNSSTFTARAVASTLTNMYAATSAAVGALSGPLHGGASEKVVEMLRDARDFGDPAAYVRELLRSGGKVMGMGHRVYKNLDPRARIFENTLQDLSDPEDRDSDIQVLRVIEAEARRAFEEKGKKIFINVDFWSGAVYSRLGIQPELYPGVFAAARIVGWTSHILELRKNNRLYRPKSLYVGPLNVPYVPLCDRHAEPHPPLETGRL